MCCHVTSSNQGLSLSLSRWGGKKRDPGNEVGLSIKGLLAVKAPYQDQQFCTRKTREQHLLGIIAKETRREATEFELLFYPIMTNIFHDCWCYHITSAFLSLIRVDDSHLEQDLMYNSSF